MNANTTVQEQIVSNTGAGGGSGRVVPGRWELTEREERIGRRSGGNAWLGHDNETVLLFLGHGGAFPALSVRTWWAPGCEVGDVDGIPPALHGRVRRNEGNKENSHRNPPQMTPPTNSTGGFERGC